MSHAALLGQIAGLISIVALIPYVISIFRGETKPNRATWAIWAILESVILASYHSSGATTTIWVALSYAIIAIIVFLLSIKYGVGGYSKLDCLCLIGALTGLILWRFTHSPETAFYITMFVDTFGFLPTYKKAYLTPKSENKLAWNMTTIANFFNVLAITSWQFKITLYPVTEFVLNGLVAVLLWNMVQNRLKSKQGVH